MGYREAITKEPSYPLPRPGTPTIVLSRKTVATSWFSSSLTPRICGKLMVQGPIICVSLGVLPTCAEQVGSETS